MDDLLSSALKEMAEDMELEKANGDNRIKTFEMNYPAWAYKWQAEYGRRRSAKKNGLKRKDLDKQWQARTHSLQRGLWIP